MFSKDITSNVYTWLDLGKEGEWARSYRTESRHPVSVPWMGKNSPVSYMKEMWRQCADLGIHWGGFESCFLDADHLRLRWELHVYRVQKCVAEMTEECHSKMLPFCMGFQPRLGKESGVYKMPLDVSTCIYKFALGNLRFGDVHVLFPAPVLSAEWFEMVHTQEMLGLDGVFNTDKKYALFEKYLVWCEKYFAYEA